MIDVKELRKSFASIHVLNGVDVHVKRGECICIIGPSGSGKSTFLRCLNLLEIPDEGTITVGGQDILDKKLNVDQYRQKVGMVFQHFNLLEQQNVLANVCFPMEIRGVPVRQRKEKAMELLKKVGLEDKAGAYPSQLSGGQKQRVAIARVLANEPDILLCDEATSALDPETTKTILDLLKSIHDTMGITMVIITHEMRVIQEICTKVAVLDQGTVQECGSVTKIFNHPKSKAAKRLLLMWDKTMIIMLLEGIRDTFYMTLASTFFGYVIGLPMGIVLTLTDKGGIAPNRTVYRMLDIVINITRSVPFLILLILVMPLTKLIVGKSYGSAATIVPLTLAAAPLIGRMVESSLKEVGQGVIEAAVSMGARTRTIVFKVLIGEARTSLLVGVTIVLGTVLGYSAMAGVVGGGGLGDIAIRYGYYRYDTGVMLVTLVFIVAIVQLMQGAGMFAAKKLDHRNKE